MQATTKILFVHGFLDGAKAWEEVIAAMGDVPIDPVTVDLAGMGERASAPGPFTLERFADDVVRQLDALHGPVVLVGHSMGSQVAELAAAVRPERVEGLVLLTPVPLAGTHLPQDAIQPFRALGGQPDAQRGLRRQLSVALGPARLEMLGELGDKPAPAAVADFADAWNNGHPDGARPSKYRGRVLVVRGAGDPFVTDEVVRSAVTPRFDAPRVHAIEHAGHWVHVEQPEALARLLRDFISGDGRKSNGWTQAFEKKSSAAFAQAFAPDVVLEASVMARPVAGADKVKTIMSTASKIYEALEFTHQTTNDDRSYLEWEAQAFGGEKISGITILTKNADGQIVRAAIHHRPLRMALKFSAELGHRLRGQVDADLFFPAS
jgi:pimeloyl-ACP methyl ester carboxylesterase